MIEKIIERRPPPTDEYIRLPCLESLSVRNRPPWLYLPTDTDFIRFVRRGQVHEIPFFSLGTKLPSIINLNFKCWWSHLLEMSYPSPTSCHLLQPRTHLVYLPLLLLSDEEEFLKVWEGVELWRVRGGFHNRGSRLGFYVLNMGRFMLEPHVSS